jgi:hypothetical protein
VGCRRPAGISSGLARRCDQVAIRLAIRLGCDCTAVVKVPMAWRLRAERTGANAVSAAAGAPVDAVCLIHAARARGVVLNMPADDAPVVATSWQPPYVPANLDLASGCVTPSS